ncbi:hypothetical protein [Agromyces silvae]|uniref:hypothetical protein n=1 Tax=Agromyces silvae TaxID=3388266 RepID=UPI00280A612A|nr:hypothetical protein [Agromyces protaetiae]
MEFEYWLTGTGWAKASVRHEDATLPLSASYIQDALGDLLQAVDDLLAGAGSSRCVWWEEPGQYWWLLERSGEGVNLSILWFDDWVREPDGSGVLKFAEALPLADLATAIAVGSAKVLAEHGAEEYRRRWVEAPFPEELLSKIQARLSA